MEFADPVAITVSCVLILICFLIIINQNKYRNFPPGPRPLPIIGNLYLLNMKKPHLTMIELSKKYGPVFSFQMGMRKTVFLAGYETVKDALINHAEEFGDRARIPIFERIEQQNGIIFAHGENWKAMRRFTASTLRDFVMGKSTIEDKIIEECGYLVQRFESFKGQPFENTLIMNVSIANIIVSILLGHRYEYEGPTFLRLLSLLDENLRLHASPMVLLYNLYPCISLLPGKHKTILKNVEEMNVFMKTVFVESLGRLDSNDQRSFIDAFLIRQREEKSNPDTYFHDKNLISLVRNLFAAGMETPSTVLRWALLLMMKYPDVQKKVQEEIESVLGSAQVQYEHRKKMPYTHAVIHEMQRFSNIQPMGIPHETTTDVNFKGYFIPKGTFITPLLGTVLQDEDHFEKPKEFYPQHFLDSEGRFVKKEAFMAFSAGRRVCVGETLARMELFLFFTSLLQKFTFLPPPGVTELDLTPAVEFLAVPMPHMISAVART